MTELLRYTSQMIIPGVGAEGQKKIAAAKVLVVGAGGLGCPVLSYLTAMGIGTIGIIDNDVVQPQNLHRQILYAEADAGKPKAMVAKEKLCAQNSSIRVNVYNERLTAANAQRIINEYDIVADCSDNIATRFVIDDCSAAAGKPFVYGAVKRYEAQLSVFNYNNGPSYRHAFEHALQNSMEDDCATAGIMGYVTGITGCMQVNEITKIILGSAEVLSGEILAADFEKMFFRKFKIKRPS